MAFENSQTYNIESKKVVSIQQFESSSKITIPQDKSLKKVVSINALPKITTQEKVGDNLSFAGRISYQIVYLTEDDKLAGLTHDEEWQGNINNIAWQKNLISVKVQECVVSDFSSSDIMIHSLLNIEVNSIVSDQIASLEVLPEDYVKLEKSYKYNKVVNAINDSWIESIENEFNGKLEELLFTNSIVNLKNITLGIDTVSLEGEITIECNALDERGMIKINKTIDFKQDIGVVGVVPEHKADVDIFVQGLKSTMSVSDVDNKTNIIFALDLGVNIVVYEEDTLSVIEDAYSIKNQTISNSECVFKETFLGEEKFENILNLNIALEQEVNEVLYINSIKPNITDIKTDNEQSTICGGIELGLVVKGENGLVYSLQSIVPFNIDNANLSNTDKVQINVDIESIRLINNRDVEIIAKFFVSVKSYTEEYVSFISKIEETEERECSNEAIIVYVVEENQTLFDVSKILCVKPEDIIKQNSNLGEELVAGDRVVVYSPLGVDF